MQQADLLGSFEQLVLLALVRMKDEAYGMSVRRELEERTERTVSLGAVYATLDRLEQKGYVTASHGGANVARQGRTRRYFQITATGSQAVRRSLRTIEAVSRGTKWAIRLSGGTR